MTKLQTKRSVNVRNYVPLDLVLVTNTKGVDRYKIRD